MGLLADYPGTYSELSDDSSLGDQTPDLLAEQTLKPKPKYTDSAPVTTGVLKKLLAELHSTIQSDVANLRSDVQELTGKLGTLENTSHVH
ncbi:Hypothetical predicted protein [Pelobates cultripes]|uniref:Uncharacterized protein n=1 Tax=Pelobates cultripes TaxID=61616 RepID=A0AAD1WM80_PELCU|nr:Hypothetical predicted protein [Pelobates cultripes]